jgi:hypothetical protein
LNNICNFYNFEIFATESNVAAFRRQYPVCSTIILCDIILEQILTMCILALDISIGVIAVTEKQLGFKTAVMTLWEEIRMEIMLKS